MKDERLYNFTQACVSKYHSVFNIYLAGQ